MATKSRKTKGPELHFHGCTRCRRTYHDVCEARVNALCPTCRMGRTSMQHYDDHDLPRPCCTQHTRLATKDEQRTYKLSASATWWLCKHCSRRFTYRPTFKETP